MYKIPYVNLALQWESDREDLLPLIDEALRSGQYIGGPAVEEFEKRAAILCNTKHCVALNSGTDALVFGLVAMGIKRGDEIITPPNSFIASTAAIVHIGAVPIFVDVLADQNIDPSKIQEVISPKTKAIMPVHLTGRMARMDEIKKIADQNGLKIIEDAAQAIGSKYLNIPSGKWGDIGCFSTHPLKNLNSCGDGGFIVTDDDDTSIKIKLMRNHGLADRNTANQFGFVSRMDAIQATILNYRIQKLNSAIEKRRKNAAIYYDLLQKADIFFPTETEMEFNTYHTFVIQVDKRDQLREHLSKLGIETSIHYPIPINMQPAYKSLNYLPKEFPVAERQANRILTLPVNQFLTRDEIIEICRCINIFYK